MLYGRARNNHIHVLEENRFIDGTGYRNEILYAALPAQISPPAEVSAVIHTVLSAARRALISALALQNAPVFESLARCVIPCLWH